MYNKRFPVFLRHMLSKSRLEKGLTSHTKSWQADHPIRCRKKYIFNSLATEKLDGTCVYVAEFDGTPWLWARHDRKPNKVADRTFKKFQNTHRAWVAGGKAGSQPQFQWDVASDFKDVPHYWVPASDVIKNDNGIPLPDDNGHIPGNSL